MRTVRWAIVIVLLLAGLIGARPVAAQDATPASLAGKQALPLTGDRAADFESYIQSMLDKTHVPGVSVAVVQDGKVVYLNGFGVRELGKDAPVTPDTLMMIGSVTKSMTSLMTGTLVDDGALTWDTTVQSLLPDFKMADPELTKSLTMREAYCMCTGVPARDAELVFDSSELTPEKLIASVADFPLTAPLGKMFQYSNQMYAIGGYAATIAAGGKMNALYDDYVAALRKRVLDPIGMSDSTFSLADVEASGDYSGSHAPDIAGNYQPVSLKAEDVFVTSVAPAGALWSNAREMARYVQTLLAGGVAPDGTRVVSIENLDATWKQQVPTPASEGTPPEFAELGQGYAMGWVDGSYHGQRFISHNGGTLGFTAQVALLPDAGLGLVVLSNGANADALYQAIQFRLLELVFGQEHTFDALVTDFLQSTAQQTAALQSQIGSVDSAAVTPYLGRYRNPTLGAVDLSLTGGKLILDAGEVRAELQPYTSENGTTYLAVDAPLAGTFGVTFSKGTNGNTMTLIDLRSPTGEKAEFTST